MDSHGSHMHAEFLNYVMEHKICLFTFPAHTTHLTQPLDVGVFQSMKHYHAKGIDQAMRTGQSEFNKLDFLHLFPTLKRQTMTPRTILGSWEKTGLVPYNPSVVLSKIAHPEETHETPPSAENSDDKALEHTPHGPKAVIEFGRWLKVQIEGEDELSDIMLAMKCLIKGSTAAAHSQQLVKSELKESHACQLAKRKCDSQTNTVAAKHGVVTVDMV